ncbi:hypothetical protein CDL12_08305 [Handroanthus impetiginosus]|uniref:Auxin response factor n=1 Tax=Handroanthus impetiginosus TaxID=429701 RepID=A0A2G9HP05_9LAMI|nr:hypothetical protein CDL12_08305 [Handroanthus impetiginosus]
MATPPPDAVPFEVDSAVWRAVAGPSIQIPALNSHVYYFPQGHLEHSSASSSATNATTSDSIGNLKVDFISPLIPCQIVSINLLIHPSSEQAFVKFLLQPLHAREQRLENNNRNDNNENDVVFYSKVLTPSDANNGGGFSVPRYCADSIFPPLDFTAEPPAQNLILKDTLNQPWRFRHIYRGTPRRHLLTTGWSKFVNAKRLIAGDTVVFMKKNSTNELFAGIRRAKQLVNNSGENSAKSKVLEAIGKAARGMEFEVVYYPRAGSPDFVVAAGKVEEALRIGWCAGMQVKIAVESEDPSRLTWVQGTILSAALPSSGPWCRSPWRMLQVSWDKPEVSSSMERVNPWQVEYITPTPPLQYSSLPALKKFKPSQHQELLTNGAGEFCFSVTDLTGSSASMASHMYHTVLNSFPFPASMQGARQDQDIHIPYLSNSEPRADIYSSQRFTDLLKNGIEQQEKAVSTALSIGQQAHSSSTQMAKEMVCTGAEMCRTIHLLPGRQNSSAELKSIEPQLQDHFLAYDLVVVLC